MLEAPTTGALTSDEELVRQARTGDKAACAELFERHRGSSYRLAYRYLGNEHDALDVVQDAMIKAFSGLGDFDGRSGFKTWLMRIVVNTALDWGRRRTRRPSVQIGFPTADNGLEPCAPDDPSRRMHLQDLRRTLDEALERLSPTVRETFVMFAEAGLSYKEIADIQDVPIGTVMSRIHAARGKLQAILDWDRLNGLI